MIRSARCVMRFLLPVTLAVTRLTGTTETYAQTDPYHVIGPGNVSCGTWTSNRTDNRVLYPVDEAWVFGFLSGVAMPAPTWTR